MGTSTQRSSGTYSCSHDCSRSFTLNAPPRASLLRHQESHRHVSSPASPLACYYASVRLAGWLCG